MKTIDLNDVIYLSHKFLIDVKHKKPTSTMRFDVTDDFMIQLNRDIASLLAGNLSNKELYTHLETIKEKELSPKLFYNMTDVLKHLKISFQIGIPSWNNSENIMYFGTFYLHPDLQRATGKTKYVMNELQEVTEVYSEDFSLELRSDFHMTDLINWFILKSNAQYPNLKSIRTQLATMIQNYGLDLTMYIVEAGVVTFDGKVMPNSPRLLETSTIIELAKFLYFQRIQLLKEAHIYGITPRKDRYRTD